ncbi:MAG: GntR family transcriptional regulator [Peptococcaceae bacterium]|nr:GntR family transcriptional regulator [Peptococcaceae bacterium]
MRFMISTLSQTPIYEQIKTQIKELVLTGQLKSGEQLPSIRFMAKDLKVGIITVKRAYDDLCEEGFAVSLAGRGVFVADVDTARVKSIHLQLLREQLSDIKDYCATAGITRLELEEVLGDVYGGLDRE